MEEEPRTIRELCFYIDGKFEGLTKEIRDIRKFVYWIAGITMVAATSISIGIIKVTFGM